MIRMRWTPEQHALESALLKMAINDTVDCQNMSPVACKEVAYANRTSLEWQGKRFVSLRTKIGQFVRRIA